MLIYVALYEMQLAFRIDYFCRKALQLLHLEQLSGWRFIILYFIFFQL